jgi:branched-chain amino acid transport system permease protein
MEHLNAIIQGILIGGLYALFAAGLSLIFGVMRLVNISHGDLIVATAYLAWTVVQAFGLHPIVSIAIVVPVAAAIGYAVQRGILNRTLGKDILPPLLVTFGLSVIIQNGLLQTFSADSRKLDAGWMETKSFEILPNVSVGLFPLLIFATAIAIIWGLQYIFYHTNLGRAFRATSDDPEIAQLMGLDNRKVYAKAMAICFGVVALAGVFFAIRANFDPFMGPARLIFGFEAVIIGGLGSLWGTLAGGVILGVAQAIGAQLDPGWQVLAGHVAFILVLAFRPRGLFPRTSA